MAESNMMSDLLYGQPSGTFTWNMDPFAQDRGPRMQVLQDRQAQLDALQGVPPWQLDPETQQYLDNAMAEAVYSQYPRAGRSGAIGQVILDQQMRNRMEQVKMRYALEESLRKSIDQNAQTSWPTQGGAQYLKPEPGLIQSILSSGAGGVGTSLGEQAGKGLSSAVSGVTSGGGDIWDALIGLLGGSNT